MKIKKILKTIEKERNSIAKHRDALRDVLIDLDYEIELLDDGVDSLTEGIDRIKEGIDYVSQNQ